MFAFFRSEGNTGVVMTENLGFLLGTGGFTALLRGMRLQDIRSYASGAAVLTTALMARAGAFFVLPALIAVAFFSFLKLSGHSPGRIWLILWGANMLISAAFILGNDRLRVDITLMQGLRNLVTAALRRSRRLGLLLEALLFVRLLLWDGPCQLLIFFRPRLASKAGRLCLFTAASGLQMLVWTAIYELGFESVAELLSHLKV